MIQIAIVEDEEIYVKQLTIHKFTKSWLNARVIATRVYHAKYKVFWESKCNYKIEVTVEIGYT